MAILKVREISKEGRVIRHSAVDANTRGTVRVLPDCPIMQSAFTMTVSQMERAAYLEKRAQIISFIDAATPNPEIHDSAIECAYRELETVEFMIGLA